VKRSRLKPRSDRAKTIKRLHELWREVVYQRDGFKCQATGKATGLNPHHVYPKHGFPSLRFDPDNGITLNMGAHMNWHDERHIEGLMPREWWTKRYPERAKRLAIMSRGVRKVDLALTEIYLRKLLEEK
jgi:hypothetical protein